MVKLTFFNVTLIMTKLRANKAFEKSGSNQEIRIKKASYFQNSADITLEITPCLKYTETN